jgi:hypothetical protein
MRSWWLLFVVATSCVQPLEPDVGPPLRAPCQNAAHGPSRVVRFSTDIAAIVDEYHCKDCHTPTGATPIGVDVAGFDISSYATLRAGGVRSGMQIVVPGQPCQSVLLQKVSAGPPFGARMPLANAPYLGDDDLQAISDWIFAGANDD